MAIRTLQNESDAQDVCQEVFMRVMRSFDNFDPTRPLSSWIGKIAYNICLKRIERTAKRNERHHNEPIDHIEVCDLHSQSPDVVISQRQSLRILEDALDKISVEDRMLVLMRYREEFSESEMAEATNMPIGTIKTKLHRARKKLKEILSLKFGGNGL
jgi:RNA polymerase sigma-70 factor (ECF subfamily)